MIEPIRLNKLSPVEKIIVNYIEKKTRPEILKQEALRNPVLMSAATALAIEAAALVKKSENNSDEN
jgi:hypothetical protein